MSPLPDYTELEPGHPTSGFKQIPGRTPDQEILAAFEAQRAEASFLFVDKQDCDFLDGLIQERNAAQMASVFLIPRLSQRDAQAEQGDVNVGAPINIYGDTIDPIVNIGKLDHNNKNAHQVRAFAQHEPSKQSLRKYGIEEEREVVFWFPRVSLEALGLTTPRCFRGVEIGDFVVWDNTWYITDNAHRDHYFGQSDRFFFTGAFCTRYHHNSVPTNMTVKGC